METNATASWLDCLIDHIQLVVRNLQASESFYTAVMSVLGIPVLSTDHGYFIADELTVSVADSPTASGELTGRHHLAFQAKDRETVDAFYSAALAHGGRDNGHPDHPHLRLRPAPASRSARAGA